MDPSFWRGLSFLLVDVFFEPANDSSYAAKTPNMDGNQKAMKCRIVCLILLTTLVSCSVARPPLSMSPTVSNTSALKARLKGLEDRGAAQVMPAEHYHDVERAISAVVDDSSRVFATWSLNEFEEVFEKMASQEAIAARDACIRLEWQVAQVEETVAGGAGCDGLPYAVAGLEDQLSRIRLLAYEAEGDVRTSLQVQWLVTKARSAMNDVIVAAAVCGTIIVDSDNADQMLEAAGRLTRTRLAYGSAVRLYANIVEGGPGTEAAAAALMRISIFGPDLQRKLAATVRSAAAACDAEIANLNLEELAGLMAALSERADYLVDPSVSWGLPELNRLVSTVGERCPPKGVVQSLKPGSTPIPASTEVVAVEDLIADGDFGEAQSRIAGLAGAEERARLEALLDAKSNTAEAEGLLRAGDCDAAIALAEKAWQRTLDVRAGSVLAGCLSARAEAALADGRPEHVLADVQRALIAAPDSGRAQRAAAAVLDRLGAQALASGDADEALRLFRDSVWLHDNGRLRLEMARLLVDRQQLQEARIEAEQAERLGESIDAETRLQVFALSRLISGETEAAWREIDTVAGNTVRAGEDLKVHLLRLPLSASLGRLAAGLAGAEGRMRRGTGVLAYLGPGSTGTRESLVPGLAGLSGPGSAGFSNDYRYMAFSDSDGNTVIFDARAGKAAARAGGELTGGGVLSLAGQARAEVVEALAWFLVTPFENALNSDMVRGEKREAVLAALVELVTAGPDYALLADSRGKATHVAGSIRENYETGLKVAAVSAPNIRSVSVEGASYREVVAPVRIGDSVQAMLVLGVAVGEVEKNQ